jgi:hypothetical protein
MRRSAHPAIRHNGTPELGHMVMAALAELRRCLFGSYRPERHYMRGPGPKWHAKHAAPVLRIGYRVLDGVRHGSGASAGLVGRSAGMPDRAQGRPDPWL